MATAPNRLEHEKNRRTIPELGGRDSLSRVATPDCAKAIIVTMLPAKDEARECRT